jgi:hypothetical protein
LNVDYERALVGMATYSHESEMALFHECTLQCAQKELDTADIVREAILQQLRLFPARGPHDQPNRTDNQHDQNKQYLPPFY